jgi:hypothetical protein
MTTPLLLPAKGFLILVFALAALAGNSTKCGVRNAARIQA